MTAADDGYSGVSFDRPGFQAMLAEMEAGRVANCVTKDLSRLGRNSAYTNLYANFTFPQLGVRYIAINDDFDSSDPNSVNNDFAGIKNWFNEFYARDTSRKIRAVTKAKGERGDYYNRACFPDEIGRYNYSIDFHASHNTENEQNARKDLMIKSNLGYGESYGIPYRCLTPRGFDNLLTAGRCISCDRYVQASVRVMPGCFITGQAAGMAASLCAEQNKAVNDIDTRMLRAELKKIGAYFQ